MKKRGQHGARRNPKDKNRSYNRFSMLEDESPYSTDDEQTDSRIPNKVRPKVKIKKKKLKRKESREDNFDEILFAFSEQSESLSENNDNARKNERKNTMLTSEVQSNKEGIETEQIIDSFVNCSQLQPELLLNIEILMNSVKTEALLDTGAATNMIKKSFVSQFTDVDIVEDFRIIKGLGDREIHTLGIINIPFSFYNIQITSTPFYIVDDEVIKVPVILGKTFCYKTRLIIDMYNHRISKHFSDGSRVDIYLNTDNTTLKTSIHESIKVFATEDITMLDGLNEIGIEFEHSVNGFNNEHNSKLYYEGKGSNQNIEGIDGILDAGTANKRIFLKSLYNKPEIECKIRKGEMLGTVSTIIEIDDDLKDETDHWSEEKLEKDIDIGNGISSNQRKEVIDLLLKLKGTLSKNDNDIGTANVTPQNIVLTDNTPIWQRPRRVADPLNEEIEKQCKELELHEIIEKSNSAWSSPLVPIRKTDGSLRLCVDYRKVNSVTKAEKFPMPNLTDSIYTAHNINFFSKLDLTKGYYQIPIHEDSRPITSFSTQHNQYQFKRLSFGLRNSGIQFQRILQEILAEFNSRKVIIYIDDIMIISETYEEHLNLLEKVLTTLLKNGIKIKVNKCEFLKQEVSFLGHIVSREGIRKCPKFIEKVQNFPKPTNINQLRKFLGLANFQRKFVDNFSCISKPLSSCTNGPKKKIIEWTDEMNKSFDEIKKRLADEVSLAFPDYSKRSNPLLLRVICGCIRRRCWGLPDAEAK